MCSIKYARPVRLCEKCIDEYVMFTSKYKELLATVVNGTSCREIYFSLDRLDVILEYHDNILSIWNKGNCNECYDWTESTPVLSNNTILFKKIFNETVTCIKTTINPAGNNSDEVCSRCMEFYINLDKLYKSLSKDSIGLDSVCFDILDSMNTTRAVWSKDLNCCKRLKSPETIFFWCTGIIAFLPIMFYAMVRYLSPLRDLPRALKESRFKQSFLRSSREGIN
nr:osteopetrosis-associated transmembrane protein 1 isoform X2 [Plodia interpunctella]